MKIGIITLHGSKNYGAVLQCYALQSVLEEMGNEVYVVDRRWGRFMDMHISIVNVLLSKIRNFLQPETFRKFRKKYLNTTHEIKSEPKLYNIVKDFDALVVGSDQVWNFDCIEDMDYYYYLNWCNHRVKKYSYAASFGRDTFNITTSTINKVRSALESFEGISVRENSGVKICSEMLGLSAIKHIDPTLLKDKEFYIRSFNIVEKSVNEGVCAYFLDRTEDKMLLANTIAKQYDTEIIDNLPQMTGMQQYLCRQISVEQWMTNIANSKYVITDSFHGMIFSIIFKKPFIVYMNHKRGATRFECLLKEFGLYDRLIKHSSEYKHPRRDINYSDVYGIISVERKKALNYLSNI